jgi:hypothetical protein
MDVKQHLCLVFVAVKKLPQGAIVVLFFLRSNMETYTYGAGTLNP